MKKLLTIFMFCLLWHYPCQGQNNDLYLKREVKKVDIPFEYHNGFIIVRVLLNDIFPLQFILDTGAEHTILNKRQITDLLQVDYDRRLTIMGADLSTELYAYLVRGIKIQVGNIVGLNRSILVLEEDYVKFESFTGIEVHGILGSDFFRRFIVKINYQRQLITLYDPQYFKPPKTGYDVVPIEVDRHKPYFRGQVLFQKDTVTNLKLLLDTGASLSLLLETSSHPNLFLPEHSIPSDLGVGLGGQVKGYLGRTSKFELADFQFQEVITHFQDLSMIADTTIESNRNGLIGNNILSRFTLIIDYYRSTLYLSPNRKYSKKFRFDKSGLQIIAGGNNLNTFIIYSILAGSPADQAGLLPGDEVVSINGQSTDLMTLYGLTRRLQKREGKKIKLKIIRRGSKRKFTFFLRTII
jgi:hypothetical protein